ncbi:MAG TPA: class I SAM-dependent methyltransferase [Polyangiaceae bacterium]|nr:class I SAM-dependent methyltransferase [Polyangiaceae bacterium]
MGKAKERETNAAVLKQAMLRRLPRRLLAKGELQLPAVPALLDHYVNIFDQLWESIGRKFTPPELDEFRKSLSARLDQAYAVSSSSRVLVTYECDPSPKTSLTWKVVALAASFEDEYQHWVDTRTPPLFGKHADAKAVDIARSLGTPAEVTVLDAGAGTGRNSLPLVREGFSVDALEPASALCKILRETAAAESVEMGIVEGNLLDPALVLPRPAYRMVLLSEVVASHFRGSEQLRQLFEVASRLLEPNGLLVFNAFLTDGGFKPDLLARQLSQVMWCALYTRKDLEQACEGLPFERLADEPAAAYEREHLPEGQYPSTGWYEGWSGGQDLFDLPAERAPVDLRWLVYRKVS